MREIKFRAWDKEEKYLVTGDDNQGSCLGEEGGYFDLRVDPDRYIIMQFTGLKDKNGKEIYEGDIIKYQDYFNTSQIGVVKNRGYLKVYIDAVGGDEEGNQDLELHEGYELEVIGNIYENPSLLEEE